MQTMIEKLELIAQCLRDGVVVQYDCGDSAWKESSVNDSSRTSTTVWSDHQYRAKPVKPRMLTTAKPYGPFIMPFDAVELTPEVRAALEAAGIEL
jgi:hypothetical protein